MKSGYCLLFLSSPPFLFSLLPTKCEREQTSKKTITVSRLLPISVKSEQIFPSVSSAHEVCSPLFLHIKMEHNWHQLRDLFRCFPGLRRSWISANAGSALPRDAWLQQRHPRREPARDPPPPVPGRRCSHPPRKGAARPRCRSAPAPQVSALRSAIALLCSAYCRAALALHKALILNNSLLPPAINYELR